MMWSAAARCGFVYADTGVPQAAYDSVLRRALQVRGREAPAQAVAISRGTTRGSPAWRKPSRSTCRTRGEGRRRRVRQWRPAPALGRLGVRHLLGVDPSPRCAAAAGTIAGAIGAVGSLFSLPCRTRPRRRRHPLACDGARPGGSPGSRGGPSAARRGGPDLRRGTGRDPLRGLPDRSVPGLQHGARQPFRSSLLATSAGSTEGFEVLDRRAQDHRGGGRHPLPCRLRYRPVRQCRR